MKHFARMSAALVAAGVLLPAGTARPCSPPFDAGPTPDARIPAGDVVVTWRDVGPRLVDRVPTNMRFIVSYSVWAARPGEALAWLGDITLRTGFTEEEIPADVVRLPDELGYTRFQVTPRAPLPQYAVVTLYDRFPAIPCGLEAACVPSEPTMITYLKTGLYPDVEKPQLPSRTITAAEWKPYSYKETCMNSTCAGLRAEATFAPATDADTPAGAIIYRHRYPDGRVWDSTSLVESQSIECTRCFRPYGSPPPPPPPQLGPIEISAIDWLGHESDGRVTIRFTAPDCNAPDAGPDGSPPAPDADAGSPRALDEDAGGSGAGGCAVDPRGAAPGSALLLVGVVVGLRWRPRRIETPRAPRTPRGKNAKRG